MQLVSANVYDRCSSRSILPWTIFDVGDDCLSLSDFYQRVYFLTAYRPRNLRAASLHRNVCTQVLLSLVWYTYLANGILGWVGIYRPPACLFNELEDGKQEINLEWPIL